MPIWNNSKMSCLYYSDDGADEHDACVVEITEEHILVKYQASGRLVQYKGKNGGSGHFSLVSHDPPGRGTLHMFSNSKFLEGSWVEEGERGMWRITLLD